MLRGANDSSGNVRHGNARSANDRPDFPHIIISLSIFHNVEGSGLVGSSGRSGLLEDLHPL